MVFLDVVYNHFGPAANTLHAYAESFFSKRHQTPWGAAINFDAEGSRTVRDFFIHNALYWLEEYHLDASATVSMPPGEALYAKPPLAEGIAGQCTLSAWTVAFTLEAT